MNNILKSAFDNEIHVGKTLFFNKEYVQSFHHFERAHILGQKYVIAHTISHIWMLRIGIKTRNLKEISGQLIRIPVGVLGSLFGIVPTGNTGGSNVKATLKMKIPDDLLNIIEDNNVI